MNNDFKRIRNRTLIITEGNHEKNKLIKLLLLVFPRMNFSEKNIMIYESNIYNLHKKIVKEYGEDWKEMDVNLPKCISRWKSIEPKLDKVNFTNIFLFFDYERHDPDFSESVICDLQECFSDANDNGQLYLNYPMVESYMDIDIDNPKGFENQKCITNIQRGYEYKNAVKKQKIYEIILLFNNLVKHLNDYISDRTMSEKIAKEMLASIDQTSLQKSFYNILSSYIEEAEAKTISYQYDAEIKKMGFDYSKINYFTYVGELFKIIVSNNIRKANMIQGGAYNCGIEYLKDFYYDELDYLDILIKQNNLSSVEPWIIWVLNTSVFIIANYKFFWEDFSNI